MGIVLPEGILNNTNLQKIREFVEGKAKILLVVSIPQDVFIASGATVKPSLLFFKKFIEREAEEYAQIVQKYEKEISKKYESELTPIIKQLALKGKNTPDVTRKKELKAQQKEIETKRDAEIKVMVKKEFDYQIAMAKVAKAGISTTGQEIENELIPLKEEFTRYRESVKLWDVKKSNLKYASI
jgi:type I restriction enzyme M protein